MLSLLLLSTAFAGQDVRLKSEDGVALHAVYEAGAAEGKAAVLVHMVGRSASDWDYLADRLARSGVSTIAVDLRGHGSNAEAELTDADYQAMELDVKAAVAWLRTKGKAEVTCVGASIGANLCMLAAEDDPYITNVVMLSPGLKYKGVAIADAVRAYGDRPVLLVASNDDQYSARSCQVIEANLKGQHHFELLEDAGHGTKMLNRDPALEGVVLSWVLGTYQLASGGVVTPKPAMSNSVGEVQTTGTKLESHK